MSDGAMIDLEQRWKMLGGHPNRCPCDLCEQVRRDSQPPSKDTPPAPTACPGLDTWDETLHCRDCDATLRERVEAMASALRRARRIVRGGRGEEPSPERGDKLMARLESIYADADAALGTGEP